MEPETQSEQSCAEFIISGIVQGVGYRFFAHRVALRLGVKGYVRNCPDGTVRVVGAACPRVLEEFEALLAEGPRFSQVTSVRRRPCELGDYSSFDILG